MAIEATMPEPELDPLSEPTARVSKKFTAVLALANLGIWTAFFAPIQFLLPLQVEAIVGPDQKEVSLGLVLSIGSLIAIVTSPVAGALSDRTTSRMGRRRPWVLWPTIAAIAVLLLIGQASVIGALVLGWALAQLALNASYAAVTAMLPDQVPIEQRGTVSAMVGAAQPLGVIVGGAIATFAPGDENLATGQNVRYILTAVVLGVTALAFFVFMKDPPLPKSSVPKMKWGEFAKGFWVSPKEHPDFAWVFITRFLVIMGTAIVTSYLLYFAIDVLGSSKADASGVVFSIMIAYIVTLLISTLIVGPISDKVGKVKPFVIGASLVAALAMVVLAFSHTPGMARIAAAIMGAGFGAYTAVDLALISRVLPSAEERAKDLGVINIANSGPQVLAPFIAGAVVAVLKGSESDYEFAYMVLYLFAAALTALGAVLVTRIKSVP